MKLNAHNAQKVQRTDFPKQKKESKSTEQQAKARSIYTKACELLKFNHRGTS